MPCNIREKETSHCMNKVPVSNRKLPERRFKAFHEVSLFLGLTGKSPGLLNKTFIRGASPVHRISLEIKKAMIGRRRWNITK